MKRLTLSIALLTACGGASVVPQTEAPKPVASIAPVETTVPPTPDAPFRAKSPEMDGALVVKAPEVQSFTLKNGLTVLFVPKSNVPIVSVRVVLKNGVGDDAAIRPWIGTMMGSLLDSGGTKKHSATELTNAFEMIGAEHSTWMEWDSGGATVKVVDTQLDKALELLREVVREPAFTEEELTRLIAQRVGALSMEASNPRAMAQNALTATVYGRAHPYGMKGLEKDLKAVKRADILRAYERSFTADNASIVVVGSVTKEALQPKLEAAFGDWKKGTTPRKAPGLPVTKKDAPRLVLVDKPGAPQSMVYVTDVGVPFGPKDREATDLMNAILGGMFTSRINLNLREKHAYSYGAHSWFSMRHGAGPFVAGGAIISAKTGAAVHELLMEIERISQDITPEELADAKENLKQGMLGRFATASDMTSSLAALVVYKLPLTDFDDQQKRIDAVTIDDVKRAATERLHARKMKVVVVGDLATIEGDLESLHLGAADRRDAYGDPIASKTDAAKKADPAKKSDPLKN